MVVAPLIFSIIAGAAVETGAETGDTEIGAVSVAIWAAGAGAATTSVCGTGVFGWVALHCYSATLVGLTIAYLLICSISPFS